MTLRQTETGLAIFTLAATAVFTPLETIASWQMGGGARGILGLPYLGSLIGIVLLAGGARHSLRARPRRAPGLMCAGHAWMAAMGWRATLRRLDVMARGQDLFYGAPEFWATAAATVLALASLACSLYLTYRTAAGPDAASKESALA